MSPRVARVAYEEMAPLFDVVRRLSVEIGLLECVSHGLCVMRISRVTYQEAVCCLRLRLRLRDRCILAVDLFSDVNNDLIACIEGSIRRGRWYLSFLAGGTAPYLSVQKVSAKTFKWAKRYVHTLPDLLQDC